ncbi:zinc finger protein, putative [Plasmodium vivax]|uniref:Zinc finger protein, putative n=1 Tax=Plasmodium vivax TaxID=5855 RepID=A0A564ZNN3_PLAVI|nr:zinc finger protein, putative [Plasmodium vivax]
MSPPEDYTIQVNGSYTITMNGHNCGSDGGAATQREEAYRSGLPPTAGRRMEEAATPFDGTHTEGGSANPQGPSYKMNDNESNHVKTWRGNNFPSHEFPHKQFRRFRYGLTRGGRANGKFYFANKTLHVAAQRDASFLVKHPQQGHLRRGQKRNWAGAPPRWLPTEKEAEGGEAAEGEAAEGEEANAEEEEGEEPPSQLPRDQKPWRKSQNEMVWDVLRDAAEYFRSCRGARAGEANESDESDEANEANETDEADEAEGDADGVVKDSLTSPLAPQMASPLAPPPPPPGGRPCCVCRVNPHKYKCPFCEALSCSLPCAKKHKKLKKCKNKLKKNFKVQKVAKKNLNESMLHKDYQFLQGVESIIHGNDRFLRIKENETTTIWLYNHSKLTSVLKKRKIFLLKAPLYTKLHQGNRTTIRQDTIFWMVRVTLVNDCLFVTHQDVSEDTPLLQLLNLSLAKVQKKRKPLRVNYLDHLNAIRVSLQTAQVNRGAEKAAALFCVLPTIRDVLRGQTFYEYPHLSFEVPFRDGAPVANPAYEQATRRQQGGAPEEGQTNQSSNDVAAEEGRTNEDTNQVGEEEQRNNADDEEGKTNQGSNRAVDEEKQANESGNDVATEEGQPNQSSNDVATEQQCNRSADEDTPSQADAPTCDKQAKGQTHVEEQSNPPPQG